ncbi:hypothetical protein RvY_08731-4 [Ramazzottius varieornatus]|uniref:Uncharacterized protein n=1 Tax=Ramazzottius varieornatus TaxID=947166 RepID=A0A1D1V6Y6_RAMVA|nr:hypothetical protein RvY_08731-4 [Ramazzottius varieornatus]
MFEVSLRLTTCHQIFSRMEHYVRYIRNASQLMAHRNPDVIAGYDQCIEELGESKWASAVIPALEMAKALLYLEQQNLTKAMEILSSHDRDEEEDVFRSQYCDLLCFLTFHRNNVQEAREFAKRSYASNKLSLQACTNLGSVEYAEANYAEALHYFQEAAMLNSADFRSSYYAGICFSLLTFFSVRCELLLKTGLIRDGFERPWESAGRNDNFPEALQRARTETNCAVSNCPVVRRSRAVCRGVRLFRKDLCALSWRTIGTSTAGTIGAQTRGYGRGPVVL